MGADQVLIGGTAYDWEQRLVSHVRAVQPANVLFPPMDGPSMYAASYDALGRRVRTRTIVGKATCGSLCDDQSSVVRYIWDGAQLLGEIRDRGDWNASRR